MKVQRIGGCVDIEGVLEERATREPSSGPGEVERPPAVLSTSVVPPVAFQKTGPISNRHVVNGVVVTSPCERNSETDDIALSADSLKHNGKFGKPADDSLQARPTQHTASALQQLPCSLNSHSGKLWVKKDC